jgi:ribosomal protein S27E
METDLTCPICSAPSMTAGEIVGRSPGVKFKETGAGLLGDLTGVAITTGVFNHSAPALRCGACGTVVVPPRSRG